MCENPQRPISRPTPFSFRTFLGPDTSDLSAVAGEITSGDQDPDYLDFGAVLRLSDGSKTAEFDFGVYGPTSDPVDLTASLTRARAKAVALESAVRAFVRSLEAALQTVEYRIASLTDKTDETSETDEQEG